MIIPNWPLPSRVKAVLTTRQGGCSRSPYASNNLGDHVGDVMAHVLQNRQQLQTTLGLERIQWLNQVHGCEVIVANGGVPAADACFTQVRQVACAVLTADCLPVLFAAHDGTQVAAAHAGWRGLAAGVLLETLKTFAKPRQVSVYLGPAIGFSSFEVGPEVRQAFSWASDHCFKAGKGDRVFADLQQLAREQLQAVGVVDIYSEPLCTVTDHELFYSYRREGITGRMASLIWRE